MIKEAEQHDENTLTQPKKDANIVRWSKAHKSGLDARIADEETVLHVADSLTVYLRSYVMLFLKT